MIKLEALNKLKAFIAGLEEEDSPLYKNPRTTTNFQFLPEALPSVISSINSLKEQNKAYSARIQALEFEKNELLATVTRNISLIEELLRDKAGLNETLGVFLAENEGLKQEIEETKGKMKKERDLAVLREKGERRKWLEAKTKEIKELTVKGLEPELARMMQEHRRELEMVKKERDLQLEAIRGECDRNRRELGLEFEYKREMLGRELEERVQRALKEREKLFEEERKRIERHWEEELAGKERQRVLERENFELAIRILKEERGVNSGKL